MNIKCVFVAGVFLMADYAVADCSMKMGVLDVRDGGLVVTTATPNERAVWRGTDEECDLTVSATASENPRSFALREFNGANYRRFKQTVKISEISLNGQSSLKFMSFDFSTYVNTYRLDLQISPGAIPAGATTADSFILHGDWVALQPDGEIIEQREAFPPQVIASADEFSLIWEHKTQYPETIDLGIRVRNTLFPINTYNQNYWIPYSAWKHKFYLTSKKLGSLSATSLTPQTSFKLGGYIVCEKYNWDPNEGKCD